MNERDAKQIGKILIVIAVALCGISLILPWSGFYMNIMGINMGIDYYPWGSHVYADYEFGYVDISNSLDAWMVFNSFIIGSSEIESLTSAISSNNMLSLTFFILSFIFCVAALVFGLISIKKIIIKKICTPLLAAIASLVAIMFFVMGLYFSFSSDVSNTYSRVLNWAPGFYMIIISMVLFFISYVIIKFINEEPVEHIPSSIKAQTSKEK
jgi:preprotein translocase subunit SecG